MASSSLLLTDRQRRALLRSSKWRKHVIGEYGQVCCLKSPYHVPSERDLWLNSLGVLLWVVAAGLLAVDVSLYILVYVL